MKSQYIAIKQWKIGDTRVVAKQRDGWRRVWKEEGQREREREEPH